MLQGSCCVYMHVLSDLGGVQLRGSRVAGKLLCLYARVVRPGWCSAERQSCCREAAVSIDSIPTCCRCTTKPHDWYIL